MLYYKRKSLCRCIRCTWVHCIIFEWPWPNFFTLLIIGTVDVCHFPVWKIRKGKYHYCWFKDSCPREIVILNGNERQNVPTLTVPTVTFTLRWGHLLYGRDKSVVIGALAAIMNIQRETYWFWLILLFTRVEGTQKINAYLAGTLYMV